MSDKTGTPVVAVESDPTQALANPEPASKDLSKSDKNNSCAQSAKEVASASTEEVEQVSNEEVEDASEEMKTETGDGGDKTEDVEYSIIEGSSQRQRPKLVDSRGFAYTLYNRNKDGSTTWRCTLRNKNAFCGTIVRQVGNQFRLGKKDHLHPGTPGQLAMANVVAQVRTAATDHLFEPASSIINNILVKNKADVSVVLLPKTRSLIRRACRVREKQYPQHPTDLEFVLEQDAIQKDFLLKDVQVRNRRHLIFSTPNQQVLLVRSTRWYMDATSKLVKPPFTQLLGIHCFVKKKQVIKQVPLTYILMTGKKKRDYKLVLKALKKRLPKEICLREIVADFEAPLWGALESVYPEITLKGCCFRWKQAVWRKMQDLGLQPAYKDKGEIYKLLQYVLGLPYLPAEIIPAMLTSMRDMADKELDMLQKLFDYVSSTWIESNQWPPEAWSCYRQCLRTATDCDGWHQRLKLTARKSRVSLYHLIELLYTEASNVDIRTELVSDKKLQRYQRKAYENTQGKIFTYWKEFESGERTAEALLQGCAYIQGNISVIKH